MYTWTSKDLTDEQSKAVLETESVLLIACPGSGKTRTLTYKVAYELSKIKLKNTFVVAITYTNSAAEEIKDRVELLGLNTQNLSIGTIHSFCLDWILRPYSLYIDELKNGFSIIDTHESQELIDSICKKYDSNLTHWDCGYLVVDGVFKVISPDLNKHITIKKILNEYASILKQRKLIDFEHILYFSFKLLEKKPKICKILSNMFTYILVDEFQDTKDSQYKIIGKILKHGSKTKLFMVGDPNQAIYSSLGGFPISKNELETLVGFDLTEMQLTKNYRSSKKIITYFDYYKTHSLPITAEGSNKDYSSVITFNPIVNRSALEDEIIKLILYSTEEKKINPNEICIVGPQWVHLASLTRSLVTKLPQLSFNGPGLTPFVHDIENFWYKVARVILTDPSPSLYTKRLRWAKEVIELLSAMGSDTEIINNKRFLEICNSITIEETEGLKFLEKFFNKLLLELHIDLEFYPSLKKHLKSFFDSSHARIERLKTEGASFINELECFKKVFRPRDGISVSSIHGVKGLEFDTVIAFALVDGDVPHFKDTDGPISSKKLLYVISSRAKKNLHLISERGRNVHPYYRPNGKIPTPILANYNFLYDSI